MKGSNNYEKAWYGVQDAKTGGILGLLVVVGVAVYAGWLFL